MSYFVVGQFRPVVSNVLPLVVAAKFVVGSPSGIVAIGRSVVGVAIGLIAGPLVAVVEEGYPAWLCSVRDPVE